MTDIVERLRNSLIDELRDQAEGNDLYSEAADEIERLRTALSGLLKYLDDHDWGTIPEGATADRARAALVNCSTEKP
jgi:hypothetical protein